MSFSDPASVRAMFSRIARRYDTANHILSAGFDLGWRQKLVRDTLRGRPSEVLDVATGSGDVAIALSLAAPEASILGVDFCAPMLAEAERKKTAGNFRHVRFAEGDGLALPLADASFDAATIAFGLRNMADRGQFLREMRRVLRPGGRLLVLEFSQPRGVIRPFYYFYLRFVLPAVAGWVTGDRAAYAYLNRTIREFPGREALAAELRSAGFANVTASALSLGIVALHEGESPA